MYSCTVDLAHTQSLSTTCLSTTRACEAQSVTGRPSAHSVVAKYRRSIHHQQYLDKHQPLQPRNHVTLNQCWFNVGPASQTVAQYQTSIDLQYCTSPPDLKTQIENQWWASIVLVYRPFPQADDICLWRIMLLPKNNDRLSFPASHINLLNFPLTSRTCHMTHRHH